MATILENKNLVTCGLNSVLGTGTKGCEAFLKKVSSIWFTKEGFKFDGSQEMTETYIQQLQAEGNLIVLKGVRTFTNNSEDDVLETLDDGVSQITREGLYQFNVKFIKGMYFQKALSSLDSFGAYDTIFVDVDNNIVGTTATDGSLKGFTTGMVQKDRFDFSTDTTGQKQGISFQFLERAEFDDDFYYLDAKQYPTFKPKRVDGINEVQLSFTAVPADLGTSITVKAVLRNDGSNFDIAEFGDFLLTVDGVTANPTASTVLNGVYTLTVGALATNEVLAISLYDNGNNRGAIEKDNVLYKSNSATATVV